MEKKGFAFARIIIQEVASTTIERLNHPCWLLQISLQK
jgi:hypothetical protein